MAQMLLLGAGASKAAGVPAAYDMTSQMVELFERKPLLQECAPVLKFVVGGLLFHASKKGENPLKPSVNIEDLFNAVQLLANRHDLEAAPFVGSWDEMVDIFDRARGGNSHFDVAIHRMISDHLSRSLSRLPASEANIDRAFETTTRKLFDALNTRRNPSFSSHERIGKAIREYLRTTVTGWQNALSRSPPRLRVASKAVQQTLDQREAGGNGAIFADTNRLMIAALKDLVWISEDAKVKDLAPLLNLRSKQRRVVVASLNYDNAIELLCKSQRVPCSTGIQSWRQGHCIECAGDGFHLLKLHGSIDWKRTNGTRNKHSPQMPVLSVEQVAADEFPKVDFEPAVIFGQRNKLTADGPFLDLLRAFQAELSKTQVLTVVGYSFRDSHINTSIAQWLNDHDGVLQIVNGPSFRLEGCDFLEQLRLFQQGAPVRIRLVPMYAAEGLTDLFGGYEGSFGGTSEKVPSAVEALTSYLNTVVAHNEPTVSLNAAEQPDLE